MTRELLAEANKLNHAITELENQHELVESMLHDSDTLAIQCSDIGFIILNPEARLDVLDIVLDDINARKEELEDKLREL